MNTKQLGTAISEQIGCTYKEAKKFLDAFADIVSESVKDNDSVRVNRVGVFSLKRMNSRNSFSPYDKKIVKVPARYRVRFSASKKFIDTLNEK